MEALAYTHLSLTQDKATYPELGTGELNFKDFNWKLPSSAWMGLIPLLMAFSILSLANSALGAFVRTNGTPLNVRSSPGGRVVGSIPNGTPISLSGQTSGGWLQLTNGNWVASRWIQGDRGGVPSGVLRPGSSGAAVTNLQNRLSAIGVYNGPITGYYGRLTEAAVRNFQASRGLPVDGIAGQQTLAALSGGTPGATPVADTARVATNGSPLNIRSSPGGRVVNSIPNGTPIGLSGRTSGGWLQLTNGNWVASRWVRGGTPTTATAQVTTNGSPLNIRSNPGGRVVNSIPNGTPIRLSGRTSGGWLQLSNGNWVASQWVSS